MSAESPMDASSRMAGLLHRYAPGLTLVAVFAIAVMVSPAFLDPGYLLNTVRQVAPVGIAAIGVTYVMILGGVDLSVGAVISFSAVICATIMAGDAANMPFAIAASCAMGLAVGAFNGVIAAYTRVSPFILTLGTGLTVYGLTQMYSGGTAQGAVSPGFREFFNHRIGGVVPVLALAFFVLAVMGLVLERTTLFGQRLFLVGANARAALLSGLPIARVTVTAYMLAGLFGAIAGVALLARSGVSSTLSGRGLEFEVLAAIVLGGTTFEGGRGGVAGTVAGVLVLVIAFNLVNISGLPYQLQLVVMGAIIIFASAAHGRLAARHGA